MVGKALSSGPRLEMLELLAQKERSVDELARLAGLSVANASQHLKVLRGAGLVETRKEGLYVYCRLSGDEVFALRRASAGGWGGDGAMRRWIAWCEAA
ncbi:MAG: metalloregulator ArsR/SmtB family transcription factor [Bryobacterales bacterium]|nr:metalloregulator ArsR/SmtB family transcription factor [Bryobacterales bacterium]